MLPRNPLVCKILTIVCVVLATALLILRRETIVSMARYQEFSKKTLENPHLLFVRGADSVFTEEEATREDSTQEESTTTTTEMPAVTTPYQLFVNGRDLAYGMSPPPCSQSDDTYLMIYVHSSPENAQRRQTVRNTWASKEILEHHKARLVFVMGEVENEDIQANLVTENKCYKDIVQGNFTDTYRNLTYKAVSGLRWVSDNCKTATYVLKTDDDIVVDIHRVVRLMRSFIEKKWGKESLLACYIWQHMNVERNKTSKWYTSEEEFPKDFFLKYCSGSAYVMSTDVVSRFYQASVDTPFFWIDDYFVTGMLAKKANVTATSLNDRYILENNSDIPGLLKNDTKTRFVFVHSPNSLTSKGVWKTFLDRW